MQVDIDENLARVQLRCRGCDTPGQNANIQNHPGLWPDIIMSYSIVVALATFGLFWLRFENLGRDKLALDEKGSGDGILKIDDFDGQRESGLRYANGGDTGLISQAATLVTPAAPT